jgi:hypothetical protein
MERCRKKHSEGEFQNSSGVKPPIVFLLIYWFSVDFSG